MSLRVGSQEIHVRDLMRFFQDVEDEIQERLEFSIYFKEKLTRVIYTAICRVLEEKTKGLDPTVGNFLEQFREAVEPIDDGTLSMEDLSQIDLSELHLDEKAARATVRVLEATNCSVMDLSPSQRKAVEEIIYQETGIRTSLLEQSY